MKPTILVVTTVHWPDDTRIRERLIRSLAPDFDVVYAAKAPGPSDTSGLTVTTLRGGRIRRNLAAIVICLRYEWDVLSLHDPELIPAGLLARLFRRKRVVLDIHENVPATALTRSWVPDWMRRPLAFVVGRFLYVAERQLEIALAETGYQHLFKRRHPVFPNFPDTSRYPSQVPVGNGEIVYLGDITIERGADVAVRACASLGRPLVLIGRASNDLRDWLAESNGGEGLRFTGVLPNPSALELVAASSVGISPLRDSANYRDSQPTKILEYLGVGVPVVASDLPGTRALVAGLQAVLLVEPGNADALADAISSAMTKEVRAAAQSQAQEIRARYRWPTDEVRAFYHSLT